MSCLHTWFKHCVPALFEKSRHSLKSTHRLPQNTLPSHLALKFQAENTQQNSIKRKAHMICHWNLQHSCLDYSQFSMFARTCISFGRWGILQRDAFRPKLQYNHTRNKFLNQSPKGSIYCDRNNQYSRAIGSHSIHELPKGQEVWRALTFVIAFHDFRLTLYLPFLPSVHLVIFLN